MEILEANGLKKNYTTPDGSLQTVVDVTDFRLEAATQIALRGESGSGKTTFLHLLAGILQADEGRVVIDGEEMTGRSETGRDRLRARKSGYIFQTFNLLQGFTALENVLLGMSFSGVKDEKYARALLGRVGLTNRADYRPRQLSVGQQQRVAVARSLANRPKIVLADEPTGNLDRRQAVESLELIREVCAENGAALLLVSHDEEILGRFENVRRIEDVNGCL